MKLLPILLLMAGVATPAKATLLDALYYFSLGSIVFGVCPDEGYKVNSDAWHALTAHAYEDANRGAYSPELFTKGGKYEKPSLVSLHSVGRLSDEIGHQKFCASIMEWAVREHPRVGRELISR